jgi:hypothetical protein
VSATNLYAHPNPIGAAQAKVELARMEAHWRECADSWPCGRQDMFGEQMDWLREYITDSGLVLH